MDAALILGAIGTATGIASGAWGVYAWRVERRDRQAEVAEERRLREEAAARDRERFELELEDRERQHRAEITAAQGGYRSTSGAREFDFELRNTGPATARHVRAWLEADIEGDSAVISDRPEIHLGPGEVRTVHVRVPDRLLSVHFAQLWLEWRDESGEAQRKQSDAFVALR